MKVPCDVYENKIVNSVPYQKELIGKVDGLLSRNFQENQVFYFRPDTIRVDDICLLDQEVPFPSGKGTGGYHQSDPIYPRGDRRGMGKGT